MDTPILGVSNAHTFSSGGHGGPEPQAQGEPGHRLPQVAPV